MTDKQEPTKITAASLMQGMKDNRHRVEDRIADTGSATVAKARRDEAKASLKARDQADEEAAIDAEIKRLADEAKGTE